MARPGNRQIPNVIDMRFGLECKRRAVTQIISCAVMISFGNMVAYTDAESRLSIQVHLASTTTPQLPTTAVSRAPTISHPLGPTAAPRTDLRNAKDDMVQCISASTPHTKCNQAISPRSLAPSRLTVFDTEPFQCTDVLVTEPNPG
jgi:hypothetical protein